MSDVSKFTLDGTDITVKDSTARNNINSISSQVSQNSQDIADLQALSRLTVAYNAQNEAIIFTSNTHNTTPTP